MSLAGPSIFKVMTHPMGTTIGGNIQIQVALTLNINLPNVHLDMGTKTLVPRPLDHAQYLCKALCRCKAVMAQTLLEQMDNRNHN